MDKKQKGDRKKDKDRSRPFQSDTDPLGSYTGCPADANDKPQQDADDL